MSEATVYDDPANEGIVLEFEIGEGVYLAIAMEDEAARQMVALVQNKLDGRW